LQAHEGVPGGILALIITERNLSWVLSDVILGPPPVVGVHATPLHLSCNSAALPWEADIA
jgi:hypothetical protein